MPVFRQDDVKDWDDQRKKDECEWCWGHDYGNCDLCILHKGVKNTEQANQPDSGK